MSYSGYQAPAPYGAPASYSQAMQYMSQPASYSQPGVRPTSYPSGRPTYYPPSSGLVPASPEPFASLTDIITASQRLENAIHASTYDSIQSNIQSTLKYLQYAKDYLTTASKQYPNQSSQYLALANQVGLAMKQLQTIASNTPKTNFASYQSSTIYNYQGVLSALYQQTAKLMY